MSDPRISERELLILIEEACNGELTDEGLHRLRLAMREDASARKLYRAYVLLDAGLYWRQSGGVSAFPGENEKGRTGHVGLPVGNDSESSLIIPPLLDGLAGDAAAPLGPIGMTRSFPNNGRSYSSEKTRVKPTHGRFGHSRWMEEVFWRLVGTFVFLSVLVVVLTPFLSSRLSGKKTVVSSPEVSNSRSVAPSQEAFATLMSTKDCRWQEGSHSFEEGTSIGTEKIESFSGTAELAFRDGARAILEGPASLVLQGPGRALLEHGKLAAQVPKRAIGFTVITLTAEIVDFGTEFGVAVSKEGVVDAAVLVGKVEIGDSQPLRDPNGPINKEKRVVTAGQAITARRDDNQLAINTANFDDVMKASLAKPFESLASMPAMTMAYGVPDRTTGDRRDFHGGVGLDFEVKSPIRIFSLGVFDHLSDGIDSSTRPTVELWSRDRKGTPNDNSDDVGREMLASQTFTDAGSGELRSGHRFKPLPKPIELPVGSYTIVAYDLAEGNPFISDVANSSQFGSVATVSNDTEVVGQVGGIFACNDNESYYGDTQLSRSFTLNDSISGGGVFSYSEDSTIRGKLFVGHFSASTEDNRREFIGVEFEQGYSNIVGVRARIYRFDGHTNTDALSDDLYLQPNTLCHFDYDYDPNYEADDSHPGPEGRLTLHLYNDARTLDTTLYAINVGNHRDANSTFDSFGMGIATMETTLGDDPNAVIEVFIDDVTYSGHKGVVDFNTDPKWKSVGNKSDGNSYGWVQRPKKVASGKSTAVGQVKKPQSSIDAVGSRFGECKPGVFPTTPRKGNLNYAAGSFEYVPQR